MINAHRYIKKITRLALYCILLLQSATILSEELLLREFTSWQQKDFVGTNTFHFSTDKQSSLVKITADKTASGLFLEDNINITKTPVLKWSWKIDQVLKNIDEHSKKGDDFAARVYVVTSTGPFPWQKRSLCYVWSNNQAIEAVWPNPFTGKVKMIALDSGNTLAGTWQHHQRNIQEDFESAFNQKYKKIEAIAIMTDTDNSQQQATGWYKNFRLTK